LPLTAGKDFQIVTFSFDPNETPDLAFTKREQYLREYARPEAEAGWHFLTGKPESIRELTNEIGFRYTYDTYTKQWAHTSALVVLTPDGRVSQYFYGIDYDPTTLRLSLVQASGKKIGTFVDHVLLYCFHYDSTSGKYTLAILRVLRVVGLATILAIVSLILVGTRTRRTVH
jgi:protein SCO1/2